MDLKMEAAKKASKFINNHALVGLGAGATIAFMADLLTEEIKKGLDVKFVTSSFTTNQLLLKRGVTVVPIAQVAEIDIYFDGCDQLDKDLNALKSGGGIHTREKLLASMAKQFILVGDETKYSERFDSRFPVVVELLPEALRYVPATIQELFPGTKCELRMSDKKEGAAISDNSNYLLDVWFENWPELSRINNFIKAITGVVETSLFYHLAHKAVLAGKDGIKILEKVSPINGII
jgi:ribose 5-phosphate isomerase A